MAFDRLGFTTLFLLAFFPNPREGRAKIVFGGVDLKTFAFLVSLPCILLPSHQIFIQAKWWHGAPASELGEYAHMGEGSTFSALWARLWGGQKEGGKGVMEQMTTGEKSKSQ